MRYAIPLVVVLGVTLMLGVCHAAENHAPPASAPEATTDAAPSDTAVIAKLDKILANQAQVLRRLDAMSQELYIIKIRASQR